MRDGVGEQDEDGDDPARDDRPQPAHGVRPAEGDVLHGDADAGQEPVRRPRPIRAPPPDTHHRAGPVTALTGTTTLIAP